VQCSEANRGLKEDDVKTYAVVATIVSLGSVAVAQEPPRSPPWVFPVTGFARLGVTLVVTPIDRLLNRTRVFFFLPGAARWELGSGAEATQ
jgi:hypothetical protein